MARLLAEARIIRCERCRRGLAEDCGFVVLVSYRGHCAQYYDPGLVAMTCQVSSCSHQNLLVVEATCPPIELTVP